MRTCFDTRLLFAFSLAFSLALSLALSLATDAEAEAVRGSFAPGTPYETPYFAVSGREPGRTVLVVGALGLENRESAAYLEGLASRALSAGRLVVVPAYVVPPEDRDAARLTRAFPEEPGQSPAAPAATALWDYVRELAPDLVVQLASARLARSADGTSYGNTLFATGSPEVAALGDAIVETASVIAGAPERRWIRMRAPASRSLVRSVSDVLGIDTLIFYPAGEMGVEAMAAQSDAVIDAALDAYGLAPGTSTAATAAAPAIDHAALGAGKLRVAIFRADGVFGSGVERLSAILAAEEDAYAAILDERDIRRGALGDFDVAVFSGGSGSRQGRALDEAGRREVIDFVRAGGGYLGICAGAYLACANYSWGLGILNARTRDSRWRRGRGQVDLELTESGRGVLEGPDGPFEVRYANGPVIEPAEIDGLPPYETWAWFRSELAENDTPAGIMVDTPAFAAAPFGAGRVAVFSPHPESSDELRELVVRALRWLGGNGGE